MSKLILPSGDDHPEAATKHLNDANALNQALRYDGAAYLVGYVVETALKSLILIEQGLHVAGNKSFRIHGINELSSRVLQLAALPSAKTARYIPKQTSGHSLYDPKSGWRETLRYRASGVVTQVIAADWIAEAQAVYRSTIVPMRLDGVI